MYLFKVTMMYFLNLIVFLILARAIMSWIVRDLSNPIAAFIFQVTEPLLMPFRAIINRLGYQGVMDFSPIMLIITVQLLSSLINRL